MQTKIEALESHTYTADKIIVGAKQDTLYLKQNTNTEKIIRISLSKNEILNLQLEIGKDDFYYAHITFDELFTALDALLSSKAKNL